MALTEKQLNERVRVICYGKLHRYTRYEAIAFYTEGIECSDGSEQERYATILCQLLDGNKVCSDNI